MALRPIVVLPAPVPVERANRGGGGGGPKPLSAARQQERLGERLRALQSAFENRVAVAQMNAGGAVPEDVLVLETAGTVEEFSKAVSKIPGFEFLAEHDELDIEPDGDFALAGSKAERTFVGRVYLVFANREAFSEMLRMWSLWSRGEQFPRGTADWKRVFSLLRNIRPWGADDRLRETGVVEDWRDRVARGEEVLPTEIELWYRSSAERRSEAAIRVRALVAELGGTVSVEAQIGGIGFHALLARLPVQAVERILNDDARRDVSLVNSDAIQFFRASGQTVRAETGDLTLHEVAQGAALPEGDPVVAVLDGLPIQQHATLAGRLIVDDPDSFETEYPTAARRHGTAMSSLVVWGALNSPLRRPVSRPVYVRPIMRPVPDPGNFLRDPLEGVPDDEILVDLIHRSVIRILGTGNGDRGVAPNVSVINLSIGLRTRPFMGTLSPLARLIDWLSWKYQVLFVVSAGNHDASIDLGIPWNEARELGPAELENRVLRALTADTRNRRLLSPAEAMNALTVGAAHADSDGARPLPSGRIDPIPSGTVAAFSAHGPGYRRSVKPEVLVPGGRVRLAEPMLGSQTGLDFPTISAAPGVEVAAPGRAPGDLSHTMRTHGTSHSAAQLTRRAALLSPILDELRHSPGGDSLSSVSEGVLLKALLVHGARWDEAGARMTDALSLGREKKVTQQIVGRTLGFGVLDPDDLLEVTVSRISAVGVGLLDPESGAEHRFPLPPSLSGRRGKRRFSYTLAWMTPVNAASHKWRKAQLWCQTPEWTLQMSRTGPWWQNVQRGTLQHEVFEGDAASVIVDGADARVVVSCREDAPGLDEPVPYAIVMTFEVADELGVDVYSEVSQRIMLRQRVRPRA